MSRLTKWILSAVFVVVLWLGSTLVPNLWQDTRALMLFAVFLPPYIFFLVVLIPVPDRNGNDNPSSLARWFYRNESKQLQARLDKLDVTENLLLFIKETPWPHAGIRTQAENEVIKLLMAPVLARLDAAQTVAELQQVKDHWREVYCKSGEYDEYGKLTSRLRDRIFRETCAREHTVRLSETVRQIGNCATVPELVECALATNRYCHDSIEQALREKAATLQLAIQS